MNLRLMDQACGCSTVRGGQGLKVVVTYYDKVRAPLDLSPLLENPKVGAVLHVGLPSVATLGVGDVLFGHIVPAGRTI